MYSARSTIDNDGGNEESSEFEGKMEILKLKCRTGIILM